jgi:hypothetical protein
MQKKDDMVYIEPKFLYKVARIGGVCHPMTPEPPTPRATAGRPASLVAAVATSDAYRASRNRRCHWAWVHRRRLSALGASSSLARPPWERRCCSVLVERHRRSPASGRHRRWPPGSPPLARPREPPPPPLKPNPWRPGMFLELSEPGSTELDGTIGSELFSSYWKPRACNTQSIYIYILNILIATGKVSIPALSLAKLKQIRGGCTCLEVHINKSKIHFRFLNLRSYVIPFHKLLKCVSAVHKLRP